MKAPIRRESPEQIYDSEKDDYQYPVIPTTEGWYHLETVIERAPLIDATLDVGFNINTLETILREVAINTKLNKENVGVLPPQIQPFLRKKNVQGDLSFRVSGFIDSDEPFKGPIKIDGSLTRASLGEDSARLEIPSLGAHGTIQSDVLTFDTINGTMLGGTFEGDFELLLEDMTNGEPSAEHAQRRMMMRNRPRPPRQHPHSVPFWGTRPMGSRAVCSSTRFSFSASLREEHQETSFWARSISMSRPPESSRAGRRHCVEMASSRSETVDWPRFR